MGGRRLCLAAIAAFAGITAFAPAARATFHEISIREIYPGSVAQPDSDYVVLQMWASGQNLVGGYGVTIYDAAGSATGTFSFPPYPYSLPNGSNQQTILVGDSAVESAFGVTPDLVDAAFALDKSGGAVCWAGSYDCASWGSFSGATPSASGSPADPGGIPDGMALRRSIAPGCSLLLEPGDDSNDSATDFFDASPNPRNNSSAITETNCTGPTSTIDTKPANPTRSTSASFTYHSIPAGATFECKLDSAAFAGCDSAGITYGGPLAEGSHTFQVRGSNGFTGPAASYTWRIDLTAPTATIDTHPTDPSPGTSVTFTYHSNESGSQFECSLAQGADPDAFSSCALSGKTYTSLADGDYTFKVRATDAAGNQGSAESFGWTVDQSAIDTTPPDTVIDSAPPNPSGSSAASFTYHSTEPGSTFECKLDAASFAACSAGGISFTSLAGGAHTFQVRATDPSANVDPTPAGYTFDVAVPPPSPAPTLSGPVLVPPPAVPNTRIVSGPRRATRDRTPTFRFRATVAPARFKCKLDRARFRSCRSPYTTKRLRPGRHRLKVRAIARGVADPTPAVRSFKVKGKRGKRRGANRNHKKKHRRRGSRR